MRSTLPEAAFHPGSGTWLVWISFPPPRDPRVDAGTRVDVCGLGTVKKPCIPNRPVAEIACTADDTCTVGVWLDGDGRSAFLAATKASEAPAPRIFVVAAAGKRL